MYNYKNNAKIGALSKKNIFTRPLIYLIFGEKKIFLAPFGALSLWGTLQRGSTNLYLNKPDVIIDKTDEVNLRENDEKFGKNIVVFIHLQIIIIVSIGPQCHDDQFDLITITISLGVQWYGD